MDKITLKSPKSITIIIEFYYNDFSALAYHIPRTTELKEDALKKQRKKLKKLFFWYAVYPNHLGFLKSA